jgi:hypothetical protein
MKYTSIFFNQRYEWTTSNEEKIACNNFVT